MGARVLRILLAVVLPAATVGAATSIPGRCAFAAGESPAIRAAVDRGLAFLKKEFDRTQGGRRSLTALALLKGGEPRDCPEITQAVKDVQALVKDGKYIAKASTEHIYEAGVHITFLSDLDGARYQREIVAIAEHLVAHQRPDGSWDYPDSKMFGDTSMSQYGMLGLWAAERAGIPVPLRVYQKCVAWHLKTQKNNGAFGYHPGTTFGAEKGAPTLSMTGAALSSLLIARMYLLPKLGPGSWEQGPNQIVATKQGAKSAEPNAGLKFGLLEAVEIDAEPEVESMGPIKRDRALSSPIASFDKRVEQALGWMAVNFRDIGSNPNHVMYYYYTLERAAALANVQRIGKHDWFEVCAAKVLKMQESDGSWKTGTGKAVGTSFAILFLTKSTAKMFRGKRSEQVGSGLMEGGRGLATNLSAMQMKNGKLIQQKLTTPVDELLAELANPASTQIEVVQQAIVEQVQLGDREALIGQKQRLLELVDNPSVEVRRTAIWALGRGGDLDAAPALIRALKDDSIDVVIEARNALCWISRKPHGFGLPENPLQKIAVDAGETERRAAFEKWRRELLAKWHAWYLKIRPYDQRDDLQSLKLR